MDEHLSSKDILCVACRDALTCIQLRIPWWFPYFLFPVLNAFWTGKVLEHPLSPFKLLTVGFVCFLALKHRSFSRTAPRDFRRLTVLVVAILRLPSMTGDTFMCHWVSYDLWSPPGTFHMTDLPGAQLRFFGQLKHKPLTLGAEFSSLRGPSAMAFLIIRS